MVISKWSFVRYARQQRNYWLRVCLVGCFLNAFPAWGQAPVVNRSPSVCNQSASSSDFSISPTPKTAPEAISTSDEGFPSLALFDQTYADGLQYAIAFSQPTGIYDAAFEVSMRVVETPELPIRYTLDGSVPSATNGVIYQGPLTVSGNTGIRAAVVVAGQVSNISAAHYFFADQNIRRFSSDLPFMVVHSFGAEPTATRDFLPVALSLLEPDTGGRTHLSSWQNYHGCGNLHLRGNTAANAPKKQLKLSLCWGDNQNRNAELLGMPADEDFVLINPGQQDRSRLNNPIMFELGRACGEPWVSRYRFVELFICTDGRPQAQLSFQNDYRGLYILAERIKIHEDRVDIAKLSPADNTEPAITGGYILKMDERCDDDEICFASTMIQATSSGTPRTTRRMVFDSPDASKLTSEQFDWMRDYISRFETALMSPGFRDPNTGYQAFIDRDSWVRQHILQMLINNVEAMRKSIYYYKDRQGRLNAGPLWDFDWALNKYSSVGWPFAYQDNFWSYLFRDPDFQLLWEDRWFALREQALSNEAILDLIDRLGAEIREAWDRDAARWPMYAQDYEYEMERLRIWFQERLIWIDSQFITPPAFRLGGLSGDRRLLEMSHDQGYTIYFTLDGSDVRRSEGLLSTSAQPYIGPIDLPVIPVLVRARAVRQQSRRTEISAQKQAVFWMEPVPLRIVAVENDAPWGNAWEYLVLGNQGDQDLPLSGYALQGDIEYDFNDGGLSILPAGDSVVVVKDLDNYQDGDILGADHLTGEYQGNLNKQGGTVELTFHDQVLQSFNFGPD